MDKVGPLLSGKTGKGDDIWRPVEPSEAVRSSPTGPRRLPSWITDRSDFGLPLSEAKHRMKSRLRHYRLHSVCESARCPNQLECFSRGEVTFMVLGDRCTRACRFCAVDQGVPRPVDPDEPEAIAACSVDLGLRHLVITSVTRDDLPDGGATQFARTVREIKRRGPGTTVEILTPDFGGGVSVEAALDILPWDEIDLFAHNLETVPRLYESIRSGSDYRRSTALIRSVAQRAGGPVKSGIMLGLGETEEEVRRLMEDLLEVGCTIFTAGQYLRPTRRHAPVVEYISPSRFESLEEEALKMGFRAARAAPLVRSSYQAELLLDELTRATGRSAQ